MSLKNTNLAERITIAVMLSGSIFTGLIFVSLSPVLPALAEHFKGGEDGVLLAQWVMTFPSVGLIIGGLAGGWLSERFRTSRVLAAGLLLYGIAGTAGLYVDTPALLLGSRFLLGVAGCFITLATTALITERFSESQRPRMFGYKYAIGSGISIGGILVAGLMADQFGWRSPFALYAVGFLALLLLQLAGGWPKDTVRVAPDPASSSGGGFRLLAPLWPVFLTIIVFGIVMMMVSTQVPFLLQEIDSAAPVQIAWAVGSAAVGSVLGGLSFGAIDRVLKRRTFLLIVLLWCLGLGSLGLSQALIQAALGCALCGFAAGLFIPNMLTALVEKAHESVRNRAIGLLYSAIFIGDFINPPAIAPLTAALGRHGAFLAVAGLCGLVFVTLMVVTCVSPGQKPRRSSTG